MPPYSSRLSFIVLTTKPGSHKLIQTMKEILSLSRYLVLIPVALSLIASAGACLWGAIKTVKVLYGLYLSAIGEGHATVVGLIAVMDTFLIATALFIFAVGLYELFIEEVELPEWLAIHDLHSLKAKLASVIILVMAVAFLEHLTEWGVAWDTFLYALAIALVSAVLIAFGHFGGKD